MNNIEKQHNSKEIYIKQNDINKYIYNRNIPSNDIEPVFDPRPTPTKYETNRKITSNVNIKKYNNFDTNNTFYPGTKKPSFFGSDAATIDIVFESNKCFTLRLIVPSLTSNSLAI